MPVTVPVAPHAPAPKEDAAPPKEEKKKYKAKEKPKEKVKEEKPKEEENPKEEEAKEKEKVPSEPAPEWSAWQQLDGGQWDGYWRAKANGDSMPTVFPPRIYVARTRERLMLYPQTDGHINSPETSRPSGNKSLPSPQWRRRRRSHRRLRLRQQQLLLKLVSKQCNPPLLLLPPPQP